MENMSSYMIYRILNNILLTHYTELSGIEIDAIKEAKHKIAKYELFKNEKDRVRKNIMVETKVCIVCGDTFAVTHQNQEKCKKCVSVVKKETPMKAAEKRYKKTQKKAKKVDISDSIK